MLKRKRRLPIILQSEMAECGLACLAMILVYYGHQLSLSQIRRSFKSTLKGITLSKLKEIAESFHLSVITLRLNIEQIASLQLPCILHWDMNHFIVVREIKNLTMIVHDPARGVRKITLEQANNSFTGIALEIKPQPEFKAFNSEQQKSTSLIKRSIKEYSSGILKLTFLSCFIQASYIGGIKLIQRCIDASINVDISLSTNILYFILVAFIGTKILEVASVGIRSLMVTSIGTLINRDFGFFVMKHILSLPSSFFENRHVGDILSRFNGIEKIRNTLTEGLIEGLVDGLVSLVTITVMCFYSMTMALVVIAGSFVHLLTRLIYNLRSRQLQEEALHSRSSEVSHFMETIKAIPSIKLFSKDNERFQSWSQKFIRSLNSSTKITWHKNLYDAIRNLVLGFELALNLLIGCLLIMRHNMTLGMLYAFLAYRQQFTIAVGSLVDKMQEYKILKLHLERLEDVISEPPEINAPTKKMPP